MNVNHLYKNVLANEYIKGVYEIHTKLQTKSLRKKQVYILYQQKSVKKHILS